MNNAWYDKGLYDMIHNRPSKVDEIRSSYGNEAAAEYEQGFTCVDGFLEELEAKNQSAVTPKAV
jgi:hypothetical protein